MKHQDTANLFAEDIDGRLAFMQMTPEKCATLRSMKVLIDRELPIGLDKFYAQVRKTTETRKFFASDAHINTAKGAQVGHWDDISNGNFSAEYRARVQKVGRVHATIGLEPRWYIGGYAIVLDHLVKAVVSAHSAKRTFFGKRTDRAEDLGEALGSLVKAVMLDMDLAISVYMDEAEKAKQTAQRQAIESEQKRVADGFSAALSALAAKDLTVAVTAELPDAYISLQTNFNDAVELLRTAIQAVAASARAIGITVGEIANASEDFSKRTEQQAASVEEAAAALEQITTTVTNTAQRAAQAGDLVQRTRSNAECSEGVVRQAIATMDEINRSSKAIRTIIDVIDEIAFQTNLLALNAGVWRPHVPETQDEDLRSWPRKFAGLPSVLHRQPRRSRH